MTYKILKDNRILMSNTRGKYAGHKGYKIFGTLDCKSGMRMSPSNRVFFLELEDAVTQGYRPCRNCKPMDEKDFERVKHLVSYKNLEEFYQSGKRFR